MNVIMIKNALGLWNNCYKDIVQVRVIMTILIINYALIDNAKKHVMNKLHLIQE